METLVCQSCGKKFQWEGKLSELPEGWENIPFSDDNGDGMGLCEDCWPEPNRN